ARSRNTLVQGAGTPIAGFAHRLWPLVHAGLPPRRRCPEHRYRLRLGPETVRGAARPASVTTLRALQLVRIVGDSGLISGRLGPALPGPVQCTAPRRALTAAPPAHHRASATPPAPRRSSAAAPC